MGIWGSMTESTNDGIRNTEPRGFDPAHLQSTVIALPLLKLMEDEPQTAQPVLIALHNGYGTSAAAERQVRKLIRLVLEDVSDKRKQGVVRPMSQYVAARLTPDSIRKLVKLDRPDRQKVKGDDHKKSEQPAIYQIWPDFPLTPLTNKSAATVKADAARKTFAADGSEIVWAVIDSGIDKTHQHFMTHQSLELPLDSGLRHKDFTSSRNTATKDDFGHGTHVAGIIAGAWDKLGGTKSCPTAVRAVRDELGDTGYFDLREDGFAGMAPVCKIVSYKVLDGKGRGESTSVIAALQHVREINRFGNKLKIHGVNLSVGYPIDPTWFACGQSPICVEVSRLVSSGVVVVVAAGNTGYGYNSDKFQGAVAASQGQTINDPGNADAAITVGSTHRDMPHTYGVSYFSSKGPTGDGRAKPDLIAPGEKILSCAAGEARDKIAQKTGRAATEIHYVEDSGTSMAAAHVSGVIAAFLSVRSEFIGRPDEVKRIFTSTATDLGRVPDFQGRGLIDLMRAIQSI
jgi:serine protease AprX